MTRERSLCTYSVRLNKKNIREDILGFSLDEILFTFSGFHTVMAPKCDECGEEKGRWFHKWCHYVKDEISVIFLTVYEYNQSLSWYHTLCINVTDVSILVSRLRDGGPQTSINCE